MPRMRVNLTVMLVGLGMIVGAAGYAIFYAGTDRAPGRRTQHSDVDKLHDDAQYLANQLAKRSLRVRPADPIPPAPGLCGHDDNRTFAAMLVFKPMDTSSLVDEAIGILKPLGYRGEITGTMHSNEGAEGEARRQPHLRIVLFAGGGTGGTETTLGIYGCVERG